MFIYLFYLFIIGFLQSNTGAKTMGHKSHTRFKHQPNPFLKYKLNIINRLNRLLNKCTQQEYLPGNI